MDRRPIPVLSKEQFQEASSQGDILSRHPCIVTGFVKQWPAFTKWTSLAYLSEAFGHVQVTASAPQFATAKGERICSVRTSFGDYLEYLRAPEKAEALFCNSWVKGDFEDFSARGIPLYCGSLVFASSPKDDVLRDFEPILPSGVDDFNQYIPFFFDTFSHYWLLVSIEGALTPLHYDASSVHVYLAQLKGRKKAILFAPEDEQHVCNAEFGWMDPENPRIDKFPNFHRATAWEAELVAGQLLIWGGRWSHHVRTLESSVTVSYEFVNRSNLDMFVREHDWLESVGLAYLASVFHTGENRESPLERLLHGLFGADTRRANQLYRRLIGETSWVKGGPLEGGRIVLEVTLQELLRDTRPGTDRRKVLEELLGKVLNDRALA